MAPTLNSTLIHSGDSDARDSCGPSTPQEETEKELSQYSPILARKASSSPHPCHSRNNQKSTLFNLCLDYEDNPLHQTPPTHEDIHEIPIWICGEPRFVSGITNQTMCINIIEALIEDELQAMEGGDAAVSHDLRDYVITERWRDVEQPLPGDTFILPLWKAWGTKCATNEVKFKLRVNKWAKAGAVAATTSQQKMPCQVTTEGECHKEASNLPEIMKHERKSDRMTMINKMMKKILKQGETIKQHLSQLTDSQVEVQRIEQLCQRVRQTKHGKRILMDHFIKSTNRMPLGELDNDPLLMPGTLSSAALTSEDEMFYMDPPILTDTELEEKRKGRKRDAEKKLPAKAEIDDDEDDELFLVIENNDDLDSGVHFDLNKRSKSQMTEMQPICSSVELTEVLLETPKRKKRVQRNFEDLKRHSLNRQLHIAADVVVKEAAVTDEVMKKRPANGTPTLLLENPDFKRTSLQFDTIRREIIVKMNDLKDLLQKEETLITNLESKCTQYKRENEIYGRQQGQVQLKVDEIQDNLTRYAKEIVQHELDLYKTKLEIRENYIVLDDLKEMLAEKDPISGFGRSEFNRLVEKKFGLENDRCLGDETPKQRGAEITMPSFITSPFVDNVHEFCDNNNESIIV